MSETREARRMGVASARERRLYSQGVSAAWRVGATAPFQHRQRTGQVMRQNLIRYIRPSTSTDIYIHPHSRDASDLPEERQAWFVVASILETPIMRTERVDTKCFFKENQKNDRVPDGMPFTSASVDNGGLPTSWRGLQTMSPHNSRIRDSILEIALDPGIVGLTLRIPAACLTSLVDSRSGNPNDGCMEACCLSRLQGVFERRNVVRRMRSRDIIKFSPKGSENIAPSKQTLQHGLGLPVMVVAGRIS
jgi:hypothetical protein